MLIDRYNPNFTSPIGRGRGPMRSIGRVRGYGLSIDASHPLIFPSPLAMGPFFSPWEKKNTIEVTP